MNLDLGPFWVSLRLAGLTSLILLVVLMPLAWVLARSRRKWLPFVESFLSLGLVIPPTVLGFYLLVSLSPQSPVGAWLDATLGLRLVFTFPGLVLASCISGIPFMLAALRTGMKSVPQSLLEASWTLGKGPLATFLRVVIPAIRPAMLVGLISTGAHTLGEFGVVLMIGGSIPDATRVVSIAMYEAAEAQDYGSAHAYALVMVVFSYGAVLAMNLVQRRHEDQQRRRTVQ